MYYWNDGTELYHHGIKGQKWGERRFQYEDGTLTPAGIERYGRGKKEYSKKEWRQVKKDMRGARKDYNERFEKRNAKELSRLNAKANRKKELYEKADKENSFYKDHGDLGKMIYESNTKNARNAYIKAEAELMAYKKKGSDYVDRKMKEQFGQDYSDWTKEVETKSYIAAGSIVVGSLLAYGAMIASFYN